MNLLLVPTLIRSEHLMPRWFLLLAFATLLVTAADLENTNVSGPEAAPVIVEHTPFSAAIVVRNPHDRAVRVDRLDATCSCMHLDLAEHFILPHQTTTLRITVDNANRSGPQRMGVSVYLTDPELEGIDVQVWWTVTPDIAVDAIAPLAQPIGRPTDIAWRDIYKFAASVRPDELQRLSKRALLTSALPGFAVLAVEYTGPVWKFTPEKQADGSWLITASAKDPTAALAEKTYDEKVVIRTNHPDKPVFTLQFIANISRTSGSQSFDPMAPPPLMMPPGAP